MSTTTISIRVTEDERQALAAAAYRQGWTLSEMVRRAAFVAANDMFDRYGRENLLRDYAGRPTPRRASL